MNPDGDVSITGYGGTCVDVEQLLQDSNYDEQNCEFIREAVAEYCCF
jgi:hypothetical protein